MFHTSSIAVVVTIVYKHDIKSVLQILQYQCSFSNSCSNVTTATFVSINNKLISASYIYLVSPELLPEDKPLNVKYCRQFED